MMMGNGATDVVTNSATAGPRRAFRGEWLAAITVLLAILGMAIASPPLVGPDEAAHQATANYTTVHILTPVSETEDYTPGILKFGTCTAGDTTKDASCSPNREDLTPGKVRILNYPPPYYWVVGLGQKFAPTADTWMDVGGRIASMLLNIAGLALLLVLVRRRYKSWGTALLLISTPMAVSLWALVNPNGWEVTTGLLFAYLFAFVWWGAGHTEAGRRVSTWWFAALAAAAVIFGLSRHDALVWLALLVVGVILMGKTSLARFDQGKALGAALLGFLAGLAWQVTHPAQHIDHNPDHVANPTFGDYFHWFNQIDDFSPVRLRQMVGVIGGLDTPTPQVLVLLMVIGWAALIGFLYARTRIPARVLVLGFVGAFIVPSLLEVLRWNDWPYWYQGRITLPFVLPFLFVLVLRFGSKGQRAMVLLSILSAFVLAFMVWENMMRYAFGIKDYIPLRWDSPAIGGLSYWLGSLIVLLMLIATGIRIGFFVRSREKTQSISQ